MWIHLPLGYTCYSGYVIVWRHSHTSCYACYNGSAIVWGHSHTPLLRMLQWLHDCLGTFTYSPVWADHSPLSSAFYHQSVNCWRGRLNFLLCMPAQDCHRKIDLPPCYTCYRGCVNYWINSLTTLLPMLQWLRERLGTFTHPPATCATVATWMV